MLTRTKLLMVAGLSLAALTPTIASAHSNLSIGVNLGGYGYAPAPVYVAPQPVYVEPEPTVVYEQAPAVVYGPTVVYSQPYWDGYRWCRGDEHRHHEWRGRGRYERDDD